MSNHPNDLLNQPSPNEYTMTLKDVMADMGYKTSWTLRRAIHAGKLKAKKFANKLRMRPEDVKAYIDSLPHV